MKKPLGWIGSRLDWPHDVCALWLGKPCVIVAWLGLALALVSPPHGSHVQLCWLQSATGIPCLGCGMTRSLSCGLRGLFAESLSYHPMGLLILGLFIFTAAQSLLRGGIRNRLHSYMKTRAVLFNALYLGFVALFVTYGFGRALVAFAMRWLESTS